jgi:AcrR family transcriptional regulator
MVNMHSAWKLGMSNSNKAALKTQAFKLREYSILDAATSLLGSKGYDLMTMDDVANAVGFSKPSVYKHFKSKEELVGEALIRLIVGAIDYLAALDATLSSLNKLMKLLEWALRVRLDGGIPFLPSTSPHVRDMLLRNLKYMTHFFQLNSQLEQLVITAQKDNDLNSSLPLDVILISYYARTCDPTIDHLRIFSQMSPDDIIKNMLHITFKGFNGV